MTCMRKRNKKGRSALKETKTGAYVKAYAPFILVAVIGFIYHLLMKPMGGDDVFFREATDGTTLWAYLGHRYLNWTSRVVSEFVLVNVIQCPILWRIIDFLMFATLPVLIARILGGGRLVNLAAAAAVLLFPFHDMGTAGWVTTTVTHFWPFWGMFYIAMLLKKMVSEERIHPAEAVFGVLVAVVTGSHEQYAVIMAVLFVLYGVYLRMQKRKPGNLPVLVPLVLVNVISLAVIAFCPGNAERNKVSIADLPIYAEFGFGEKLYLGLLSIERVFIANADIVFCVVISLWTALVCMKTKDFKKTLISALPLFILFGQTVLRAAYPGLSGLFVMPGQILEWSWSDLSTWIPMVYLAATVASMIYALYQLFGEDLYAYICVLVLLGCGFGAGMILGFMATIYVSGERVYAPLYGILLMVTLFALNAQKEAVTEKLKTAGGKLAAAGVVLCCLVNVLFITLSV